MSGKWESFKFRGYRIFGTVVCEQVFIQIKIDYYFI